MKRITRKIEEEEEKKAAFEIVVHDEWWCRIRAKR